MKVNKKGLPAVVHPPSEQDDLVGFTINVPQQTGYVKDFLLTADEKVHLLALWAQLRLSDTSEPPTMMLNDVN